SRARGGARGLRSWCRPPPSAQHNLCFYVQQATRWRYPTSMSVRQALAALRQKPLHPFIDKAAANPDRGRNGGDRLPLGDEEDYLGTPAKPRPDGRRPPPTP